jgi:DNA-binding SARP family transcriptional activator
MTRRRARRLTAAVSLAVALSAAGWRTWPSIGREVRLRLAERSIAVGRLDEAEARLDLLISEEPRQTRPRLLLVRALRKQGRITDAEEALQRAVELGLPVERGRREYALLRAGQDFPGAEKSLRRLLEKDPGDEEVRRALAEGYARFGR